MHFQNAAGGKAAHQRLPHLGRIGAGLAGEQQRLAEQKKADVAAGIVAPTSTRNGACLMPRLVVAETAPLFFSTGGALNIAAQGNVYLQSTTATVTPYTSSSSGSTSTPSTSFVP